jgi:hypothetical protein
MWKRTIWVGAILICWGGEGDRVCPGQVASEVRSGVQFRKEILDSEFRSEGVAVADLDRDGDLDVVAGLVWYEAPSWRRHEIAPLVTYDAAGDYSDTFAQFTMDIDRDGWPDLIRIDWPGRDPAVWYENPRGKAGHWPVHRLAPNACNESPLWTTIDGAGPEGKLIFSVDDQQMVWLEPGIDPTVPFRQWPISLRYGKAEAMVAGVHRYAHGLGYGDLDSDGIRDVLHPSGFWRGPRDPRAEAEAGRPWPFVRVALGEDAAQMHVIDVNGDGLPDVVSSSAHGAGVWWHEQQRGAAGEITFRRHLIDASVSQTHALEVADLDRDGLPDLITGKRFWAHGPKGDLDPDAPAVIQWYKLRRHNGQVEWDRYVADDDSGIGTQLVVADLDRDGKLDLVTSNKKGVRILWQLETGRP